jgi:putative hydrolase of the HAD superfamily
MTPHTQQPSITDIIFDLGKVLVPFDWNIAFGRLTGLVPDSVSEMITNDRESFVEKIRLPCNQLELGALSFEDFFLTIGNLIGLETSLDNFRSIWCDIFWLNEDVVEIGTTLAEKFPCWLMSNTNEAHYNWIMQKFPSVRFYRAAALSYELGHMKPDVRYYTKALNLFGVDPQKAVFIDDILENLEGAALLGIRTIRFENARLLTQKLNEFGVYL